MEQPRSAAQSGSKPHTLKRISLAGGDTTEAELTRARTLREARTAAVLRHPPHVVATYDLRLEGEDIWLVLEYLPARSLAALRRERGSLGILEVASIGAQVADALAASHARRIVHRDVTPGTCSSPRTARSSWPTSGWLACLSRRNN